VGPRTDLDDVEGRKFLILPGLEQTVENIMEMLDMSFTIRGGKSDCRERV
jgi:hypothetical protein